MIGPSSLKQFQKENWNVIKGTLFIFRGRSEYVHMKVSVRVAGMKIDQLCEVEDDEFDGCLRCENDQIWIQS